MSLPFICIVLGCNAQSNRLTTEERSWLDRHATEVQVTPDPAFPPIDFFNEDDVYSGISADYLDLIEDRIGIQLNIQKVKDWASVIEAAKTNRTDIILPAQKTANRSQYLLFTKPYIEVPTVIVTQKSNKSLNNLAALKNKRVAVIRDHAIIEQHLNPNYPSLNLVHVKNAVRGLLETSFGEVDATLAELPVATYYIEKLGISNLCIAGQTTHKYDLSIAIRKDLPVLHSIIEKGLSSISPSEREAIHNKWISIGIIPFYKNPTFQLIALTAAIFIIVTALWVFRLEKEISQRKLAEETLRKSEEKYSRIFKSALVGIFRSNIKDGKILSANETIAKELGYGSVQSLKDNCVIFEHYVDPKQREELIELLKKYGTVDGYEIEILKKSGGRIHASLYAIIYHELGYMEGIVVNITQRKKIEKKLADSEKRLFEIIEFLPDATFVIDINGRLIAWNKAVERMTGVKKEELLNRNEYAYAVPFYGKPRPILIDLVLKRDAHWEQKYINICEEDGVLVASEAFLPHLGESGCYIAATASRLYDAKGNVVGAIESIRDVTDSKNLEKDREKLIVELKSALSKVKTLSGMLPICASCKKIRDDKGYWNQIESYINKHSEAEFSHSICPDCADKLYPDLDL